MSVSSLETSAPTEPIFGRLLTAMVTPFHEDGSVDVEATAELAKDLVDRGHDGLVVCGTTGEYSTMTDEENQQVFRTVSEAVGDRATIVAGVGSNDTQHTLHLAQLAEEVGVDGLLVVTPYYNKPTQTGLLAHFTTVADAVRTPVMLYDIPGRAGIELAPETIIELSRHPRIVAVKDAKADFDKATQVMAATDLQFYSGDDGLTLPWLAIGAVGLVGVTTQVAPEAYRELIDAFVAGDHARALEVHRRLHPVATATMGRVPGLVAAKTILQWQGRLASSRVRLPHVGPTAAEEAQIRADLSGTDVLPAH